MNHICSDCKQPCKPVEEAFDYSGTHCSHGKSGTHHTGHYVSDCCLAELEEDLFLSLTGVTL